jgi:perosamine synthetase
VIATKPLVLMRPHVPESAIAAVSDVLRSRWIGQGPRVDEFERQFAARMSGRPCVAVSSGTAALHLAYLLAGIGPGDEVIAPLFTCTATNEALLYCGAQIKFADVGKDSLNVDPAHVASLITERTKAVVVVHYGGQRVPIVNHLLSFEPGRYVPVIEDCAQALGEPVAGQLGDYACFSFQAVKHVTTGDGGMLVLSGEKQLDRARQLRWFGIDRAAKLEDRWQNDITELGYKYQMTDIGAALGIEGLKTLDWQVGVRRAMRDAYVRGLAGIDGIRVLDTDPDSACWLCTVLVERREDFRRKLADHGIESNQVHYRNDRYSIFRDFRGVFPNMDAIDGKYLCLPLHMGMEIEDVERVCEVVRSGW